MFYVDSMPCNDSQRNESGLGHNAEDHSTEYSHLASETSMLYYEPGLSLIKTLDS